MARARNIKPSFFKNELLVEMGPFDRLLFIGLWCLADREGRIEDRPKRIKMELFPCDTYDVDQGLNELVRHGFLNRYEAGGVRVVSIVNFLKHQTPHGTEKDSELPDKDGEITIQERGGNGYVSGKKRKNNVNFDLDNEVPPLPNSAKTVNPPGTNALNPDSLNPDSLNPDSLNPDSLNPEYISLSNVVVGDGAVAGGDSPPGDKKPSEYAVAAVAMRKAGVADAHPGHAELQALVRSGVPEEVFSSAATDAVSRGKGFAYALSIVKSQLKAAADVQSAGRFVQSVNPMLAGAI